jgi:hypothetical protein
MKRNKMFMVMGSLVLLTILVVACGSGSTTTSTGSTNSATAVSGSSTVTGAKTPGGNCNTTYGCGTGSSNLTGYKGNGYMINYPGSWAIKSDGNDGNIFSAPDNSASLHVFANSSVNPLEYEFGTLAKDNCKPVAGGMQSVQSQGVTWQETQFVCQSADNGQGGGKTEQVAVLTTTSVHNNIAYNIDYMAEPNNFNHAYQTFFKPMVASFKYQ